MSGPRIPERHLRKDLRELVKDRDRRRALSSEMRPRDAEFWIEPLPDVSSWRNAPCAYLAAALLGQARSE